MSNATPVLTGSDSPGDTTPPRSGEDSDLDLDDACPICLQAFRDRSLLDACLHAFCFRCIGEWAKVSHQCPLCKRDFGYALHELDDADTAMTYEKHFFPPLAVTATASSVFRLQEQRLALPRQHRPRRSRSPVMAADIQNEQALRRRRLVYRFGVRAKHVGTNPLSRCSIITPDILKRNPARLTRLRPWIRRDLMAALDETDVELVLQFVEGVLTRFVSLLF
jgi:hypothetical protein